MSKIIDTIEDLRNVEDLAGPAQEVLVSGDNIKTVNGLTKCLWRLASYDKVKILRSYR